jgi:hypothetical protein
VICRKDKGVIDEIPGAYKDIDEVMANQNHNFPYLILLRSEVVPSRRAQCKRPSQRSKYCLNQEVAIEMTIHSLLENMNGR